MEKKRVGQKKINAKKREGKKKKRGKKTGTHFKHTCIRVIL